jgi:hypothetical protein
MPSMSNNSIYRFFMGYSLYREGPGGEGGNAHENRYFLSDDTVVVRFSHFRENGHLERQYGGQKSRHL